MPLGHLYVFFGEMLILVFWTFIDWVWVFLFVVFLFIFLWILSCNSICIFWKLSLCQSHCLQIFSPSSLLVFLFMASFAVQKLSSLVSPICLFLLLFPLLEKVDQKRSCCDLCQRVFCLCFPVRLLYYPVLHLGLQLVF